LIECALKEESMNKSEVDNIIIPERLQKKFREIYTPLSAAVSPMTDVDALDLGYSQRFQVSDALSIAAALSAGGSKASAAYFREWAKRRQQDVRTRTSYAAVTSFSNGGFFGWRIKPRLQALENPALFESKPENVLEQQAFPAVVIVGIDTDDLQLGFDVKSEPNGKSRLAAYEPMISFRQSVSWLPNQSTCNLRERLSETERLRSAYNFIQAHEDLNSVIITDQNGTRFSSKQKNPTPKSDVVRDADRRVIDFIKNRITLLRYHTLDSWNAQYIPIELMVRRVAANKTDPNTKGKK